jgi:adenylate cyclase
VTTPPQEDQYVGRIVAEIASWLVPHGLANASQEDMLEGYCVRLAYSGIPVQRVHVAQRALHPVFGGLGFDWYRSGGVIRKQYARTSEPAERWVNSPFYYILKEGISELRERLADIEVPHRFPVFDELRSDGATDYFAVAMPFEAPIDDISIDPDHPPEGIIISWTSDAPNGFSDLDIGVLRGLLPTHVLTLRSASGYQMARDFLSTY